MMSGKKIIVTGSNGQLGSELKELSASLPGMEFVFLARQDFSLEEEDSARRIFALHQPDYLVNCAAFTAVDKAESEKEQAKEINATAVGRLALLCRQSGTRLIHISTDYVFDGTGKQPLTEEAQTGPINVYGATKLLGEELALQNDPEAIIIRTSWVYSSYGSNFVKTMLRLMRERESISVVNDQFGSPTYASDLAAAILDIILSGMWVPGIYNYSNSGVISWFDFATEIRDQIHARCTVLPITTDQYPTAARRPGYSVLDKSKISQTYPVRIREWKESLKSCLEKIKAVPERSKSV